MARSLLTLSTLLNHLTYKHPCWKRIQLKYQLFLLFFLLAVRHSMWDLSFPDQGWNPWPLQWKRGVLTTGPPGIPYFSYSKVISSLTTIQSSLHSHIWHVQITLHKTRSSFFCCCSQWLRIRLPDIENGLEDTGRGKGKLGRSERVALTHIHYQM